MKKNIGNIDRLIRVFIGAAVISLIFLGPQTMWGYLGLIALLTAISGFCPLYKILGIESSRK